MSWQSAAWRRSFEASRKGSKRKQRCGDENEAESIVAIENDYKFMNIPGLEASQIPGLGFEPEQDCRLQVRCCFVEAADPNLEV